MTRTFPIRFGVSRWRAWGPPSLAVALVAALICLAAANVVVRANWNEVVDGVLWIDRAGGVAALEIAPGEAGEAAGIEPGDVLLAIDGAPIESAADVVTHLHAGRVDGSLAYTLLRFGEARLLDVSLQPVPAGQVQMYFVLVGIGVFTLLVGASVRLRRPGKQATLHFFWLSVAFFGVFAFSFSGRLDRLDWVFYTADAICILVLAPMFVHFALVFPERAPGWIQERLGRLMLLIVYAPATMLGLTHAAVVSGDASDAAFTTRLETVERLEFGYLAACVVIGLALMILTLRRVPSVTAKRQLRWIVWGAVMGGLPFAVGYAFPWAFGFNSAPLDLTAIPLSLIPLAFASAIVQYRLRDVEVIIKRGLVYTAAVAAMVALYFVLSSLASAMFLHEGDQHDSVIALLATAVVVLVASPVKNAIQSMLDRAYYRDRYDYRRALVGFARDLNSDLDLNRLAERLVNRVTETLAIEHTVLMLAPTDRLGAFAPFHASGLVDAPDWPSLNRASSIGARIVAHHTVMLDEPASARRHPETEVAFWRDHGLHYFVPCVSEEGTIAVLALGGKPSGEPLSSEDVALLAAVAGQAATAIENGRLFTQLQMKAAEVDRIREFNENIIESLNDGLVVLDLDDRVLRWNAALERLYGVTHETAVGQLLTDLFDTTFTDRLRQARGDQPDGTALYRVPLMSRHEDGPQRLLLNAALAPLRTPEGDTAGAMIILEDITARVQLEEQLQLSDKMASIGLLAAGVAHEVNTPLTGISSFTQMLLEGTQPDDPRKPLLEKIERQTFRAAKIVNGLLNLARPSRSDDTGPVDVNVVINDVMVLLEHQLATSNIQVRRELSPTPTIVQGSDFKLQQVFLNLFLNARDAMPNGGSLSVASRVEAGQAVIEVADTGVGISGDALTRIYDPFFTTKAVGRGTGLGLSITYGVIQEHHGTIECKSEADKGTRFIVTLPLPSRGQPLERAHA
ncbi:MAG: ATP-binding protein [Acidobacteria bacterium]|nr:ATP-binding protein [Acidobacteriota bacterium]